MWIILLIVLVSLSHEFGQWAAFLVIKICLSIRNLGSIASITDVVNVAHQMLKMIILYTYVKTKEKSALASVMFEHMYCGSLS